MMMQLTILISTQWLAILYSICLQTNRKKILFIIGIKIFSLLIWKQIFFLRLFESMIIEYVPLLRVLSRNMILKVLQVGFECSKFQLEPLDQLASIGQVPALLQNNEWVVRSKIGCWDYVFYQMTQGYHDNSPISQRECHQRSVLQNVPQDKHDLCQPLKKFEKLIRIESVFIPKQRDDIDDSFIQGRLI